MKYIKLRGSSYTFFHFLELRYRIVQLSKKTPMYGLEKNSSSHPKQGQ